MGSRKIVIEQIKSALLMAIEKSAVLHACANNYVKSDIGNPKNAAANKLQEALDSAVKQQNITEIEKASNALEDFFKTNGIPCELPPTEGGPAADATLLKNFRTYLEGCSGFSQNTARYGPGENSKHRSSCQAVAGGDRQIERIEAKQFKTQLDDLLEVVNGFKNFISDREEQRQRELSRQFTLESAKAEKGIYFITEYLRENLTNSKTETLSGLRMRLDNALRPSAISEPSVNALSNTNGALDAFVRDNSLSSDYARIVANFGHPSIARVQIRFSKNRKDQSRTERTRQRYGILYNSSTSAPSVTKDISGKFIFLAGSASVCFAQSALIDEDQRWFLERTLRQDGAKEIKEDSSPCDFAKVPTSFDLVVFQRGELRKQRKDYIIGLTDLLQNEVLREYRRSFRS